MSISELLLSALKHIISSGNLLAIPLLVLGLLFLMRGVRIKGIAVLALVVFLIYIVNQASTTGSRHAQSPTRQPITNQLPQQQAKPVQTYKSGLSTKRFLLLDDAVFEALEVARIYSNSVPGMMEYGGMIFEEVGVGFLYQYPVKGTEDSVPTKTIMNDLKSLGGLVWNDGADMDKGASVNGYQLRAVYHIHPPYEHKYPFVGKLPFLPGIANFNSDVFSGGDIKVAMLLDVPAYILTPECEVRVLERQVSWDRNWDPLFTDSSWPPIVKINLEQTKNLGAIANQAICS